jgi:hypothetical protein
MVLHPVVDWALPYEEAAVRFKPARDRAREEKTSSHRCGEGGVQEVGELYTSSNREGHKTG